MADTTTTVDLAFTDAPVVRVWSDMSADTRHVDLLRFVKSLADSRKVADPRTSISTYTGTVPTNRRAEALTRTGAVPAR